jgi:hypothetical protein
MPRISIELPYTALASKNRKFAHRTRKVLSKDYVKAKEDICLLAKSACANNNITFKDRKKVVVDLMLIKSPKMVRTDASNFLEVACDGIRDAIGIDDCWFSGSFDWENGDEPLIIISVSQ